MARTAVTVYHNPSCGTSRGVLELLAERGIEPDVVQYLKTPPDRAKLAWILDRIDVAPPELVRNDNRFKELGLDKADYTTKAAVLDLLLEHPELMQRPIAIKGDTVVLARPKDRITALL